MTSTHRVAFLILFVVAMVLWRPWRIDQWLTEDQQAAQQGDHGEAALDPRQRQRSRQLRDRRVTLQQCHEVP